MLRQADIVHRTPARFRVKIRGGKGNKPLLDRIVGELAQCEGVDSVQCNPITGTLLVSHKGAFEEILDYAEKRLLFTLVERNLKTIAHVTLAAYGLLDSKIKRISGGELDLPQAAFITFIGTGIYQLARGRVGGPTWHNAFWYAMNVFLKAQAARAKAEIG